MKLNVYGKLIEVSFKDSEWQVYYLGNEGKKRLARDIHIPKTITADNVSEYLADLCHEWATPTQSEVKIIS